MLPSTFLGLFLLAQYASAIELVEIKSKFAPVKKAIVVVGGWRSGKNELVKIMTADNSLLRTVRTQDGDHHVIDANGNFLDNTMDHLYYPVLFTDKSTRLNFYVCPTLDSSRVPMLDFLVDFFTTQMMKSVISVKFLFVIDWNYFQKGNPTTYYLELVRGISLLVPNLDRFQNSMFLVVTKARTTQNNDELVRGALDFLSLMDEYFQKEAKTVTNSGSREDNLRYQKITWIFKNQARIGISHYINAKGVLSNNPEFQADKRKILEMMERSNYTEITPGDIGSALNPKSIRKGLKVLDCSTKKVKAIVATTFKTANTEFSKVATKSKTYDKAFNLLDKFIKTLKKWRPMMIDANGTTNLIRVFKRALVVTNVYLPQNLGKNAGIYRDFQSHVEKITGNKGPGLQVEDWLPEYDDLVSSTETEKNWYDFLLKLNEYVSSGKLISHSYQNGYGDIKYITSLSFPTFLDQLTKWNTKLKEFSWINDSELNNKQVSQVNDVISPVVKNQIRGSGRSVSDDAANLADHCFLTDMNFPTTIGINTACITESSVYIFSTSQITINEDIALGDRNLYIISPTVTVNKNLTIFGTGENGKNGKKPKTTDKNFDHELRPGVKCPEKNTLIAGMHLIFKPFKYLELLFKCTLALATPTNSTEGDSGPGNQGGNIIIITQKPQNFNYLTIASNGGNGGRGADGPDKEFLSRETKKDEQNENYVTTINIGFGGDGSQGNWGGNPGHGYIFGKTEASIKLNRGLNGLGGSGGRGGWPSGSEEVKHDFVQESLNIGSLNLGDELNKFTTKVGLGTVDKIASTAASFITGGFFGLGRKALTHYFYEDIIPDLCKVKPRCLCAMIANISKTVCVFPENAFDFKVENSKRTYPTETDHTKAECCTSSVYDGVGYYGPRDANLTKPPLEEITVSNYVNLYKKFIIPIMGNKKTNETSVFFDFLRTNPSLEGSHDATALIEEMAVLNSMLSDKRVDKQLLIELFQKLTQDIISHVKKPVQKILKTTCLECKHENGNFNDNCNSVYKPTLGITNQGEGPTCSTEYITKSTKALPDDTTRVLGVAVSAAQGQIQSLKEGNDNNLIIDIVQFIDITKNFIKEYLTANLTSEMKNTIKTRIDDSNKIITEKMKPRIKGIQAKINLQLASSNIDLKNKVVEINRTREEVKKKKDILMASIGLKCAASIMDLVADFAAVMGPKGAAAAAAIKLGTGLIKLGVKQFDPTKNLTEIKNNARISAIPLEEYLRKMQNKLPLFDSQIQELEAQVPKLSESSAKAQLSNLAASYQKLRNASVLDNNAISTTLSGIVDVTKKFNSLGQKRGEGNETEEAIGKLGTAIQLAKSGLNTADEIADALSSLNLVDDTEKVLAHLAALYDGMILLLSNFLTPMVNTVISDVLDWTDENSPASSLAELDFESFKLEDELFLLRQEFVGFENTLGTQSGIPESVDELNRATGVVLKLHERNLVNTEKITELDYHSQLAGVRTGCKTSDAKLKKACEDSELALKLANCLWMYNQGKKGFLLNKFPLGFRYRNYFLLPDAVFGKSFDDAVDVFHKKLDDLLTKLKVEGTTLIPEDIAMQTEWTCNPDGVIYQWASTTHQSEINRILSGEAVTMEAFPFNTVINDEQLEAVKFKQLHLEFSHVSDTTLSEINDALLNFDVKMIHSGTSRFKIINNYFSLDHDEVELKFPYSLKKDKLTNSNEAYQKIARGDWALSPFTSWTIQLNVHKNRKNKFSDLKKFIDMPIDLNLCGYISHIDSSFFTNPKTSVAINAQIDEMYGNFKDKHVAVQDEESE